ncbi:MAG: hypothetical protein PHO57_09910 [Acidithiobacillus sp.]|nr:hypothetical protein [Acidithiobacillus sp.]
MQEIDDIPALLVAELPQPLTDAELLASLPSADELDAPLPTPEDYRHE